MTLTTTVSRYSYAGNGVTTVFSFPAYFLAQGDLVVILKNDSTGVETVKVLTTHYTVAGAGVQAGGSVTMLTAPATGETLTIYRDPAATQGLDLVENDSSPAESNEMAFDRAMMIIQRLKDQMSRAVKMSEGYAALFDPSLPTVLTPGAPLIVNALGTGIGLGATTIDQNVLGQGYGYGTQAIANNQVAAANVTGCLFDSAITKSARIQVGIRRSTSTTKVAATGYLWAYFDENTSTWQLIDNVSGDEDGVTFTITAGGQVQYASDNQAGTGYLGNMSFLFTAMTY